MGKTLFAFVAGTVIVLHAGSALADGGEPESSWFEGETSPPAPPAAPPPAPPPATTTTTTITTTTTSEPPAQPARAPLKVTPVVAVESRESREKATSWYGWQTILVDVAAVTAMTAAVAESGNFRHSTGALLLPARLLDNAPQSTPAIDASIALYTLGPAVVHAFHGRGVQAAASPAIRTFAPAIGTIAGAVYGFMGAIALYMVDPHNGDGAEKVIYGGMASGYVAGFIVPMFVDASLFGHEPADPESRTTEKKVDAAKLTWNPRLSWSKETKSPEIGISGTF